ncbi:MAG: lipid carrier--UDP-N-acetylgalactosaminyltransferase [Thermoplasmata archaeon M9B2D]|nr:MAG: lipid carrier--UDP-N-acetylgalactosaminyltransferase [Thermoplasmata archaeon M9B2D]
MIRFFDIFFSGLALIVLSPLLVPVAVVLRFTGEGEVFYVQQRVGLGGKKFGLIKFVTMLKDSPNMGTGTVTIKNDPRVLPFGKYLRKTKINELTQLINILKGDMSVVGPRPQDQRCFDVFSDEDKAEIVKIRPGLSGVGAIVFRDEEHMLEHAPGDKMEFYDYVLAPYKGQLETWYVKNISLVNYFKVILATVWVLLVPRSKIYERWFEGLPTPPAELREGLSVTRV